MRRFLGATINTSSSNNNTSRSTTPSSSVDSSPSPSPRTPIPNDYTNNNNTTALVSSTKRAFQQTFGQLSYSKSNASSRNNAQPLHHQKQVPSVSLSLPDDHHHQEAAEDIEASSSSSPVPPTPPSKHGHTLNDEEDDNDNEPAWVDDARSLPFGSSSLLSRAPSSSSRGMIGRSSNSSSSNGHHSEYNEQDTTIVAMHQDPSSSSHQRNSTATISASRYKEDHHHHNQPLSPSMQDYNGSEGLGSLAASNSLAPATMHLSSSQQSPQLYNHTGLTVSATYAANASSLVDLKDEMMLELLSSDALIHVAQFEILGFDEVEELRKVSSIPTRSVTPASRMGQENGS